jgi:hypothetical protein
MRIFSLPNRFGGYSVEQRISRLVSFLGGAAGAKMVTSHKVTIFVPSCNSALWNADSARNLTLTITFLEQCEYLSTDRSLPVFARLTAWWPWWSWWRRNFVVICILQAIQTQFIQIETRLKVYCSPPATPPPTSPINKRNCDLKQKKTPPLLFSPSPSMYYP